MDVAARVSGADGGKMNEARTQKKERLGARAPRSRVAPARTMVEDLEIRTTDGTSLRATVREPPEGVPFAGTCVLAHALFARRTSFDHPKRPGLAAALASLGFRTIAFDFRGHGESRPPARSAWGYDELVASDLPSVVACARARGNDAPVIVLGHSLGGHVALASQGAGYLQADGVVVVASTVWVDTLEPSRVRSVAKRAVLLAMNEASRRVGFFPARALRIGSDDASRRFVGDLARFVARDSWTSRDGRIDYLAGLSDVRVPVCAIASHGDRVICPPDVAEAFARRCAGPVRFVAIDRSDDGGAPPGHMGVVTSTRALATMKREIGAFATSIRA